ncbi:MAS20-domain-containing protein [Gymnopus androsaceus JB14]|uniref:MAS20-domain-containing protein n=1 Tax=Gymnopus androsaceus JB14 TaxID=1447944 RepID=A0A6A4I6X1_9AGAR|nr:MAS20-domain-containing protein [Gymnopus androsaceus JB14]
MSTSSSSRILTVAGIATLGLVAYAVYFDYKRRNDVDFRKKLKKDKKRVDKSIASSRAEAAASLSSSAGAVGAEELREALEQVKGEPVPVSPTDKEGYFMTQVASGEQLALQGPLFYLPAALAFYRALRVYPSPAELMVIYQKTVPEPVFKLVIELMNLDIKDRVEGYYTHFPPKSFNVKVESHKVENSPISKKVLVLTKDVKAGEVIYKENPIVTALDSDLQASGTYCSQCLRPIDSSFSSITSGPSDSDSLYSSLPASYCSSTCLSAAQSHHHNILFTLQPPLPPQIASMDAESAPTAAQVDSRRQAQVKFVEYLTKEGGTTALLVARFIVRQVAVEMEKLLPGSSAPSTSESQVGDYTNAEGPMEYLLADHFERLRFVDVTSDLKEEQNLISAILEGALPGLDAFVTDERYATLVGKMMYNAFGVCYDDDQGRPPIEGVRNLTRTPLGSSHPSNIGSAVYTVSSYLSHSCSPNARPSFRTETGSQIHLVATRDMQAGENSLSRTLM